jgi:hypothetical protein
LKPGECKIFTFSFRSEKPGMYFEEWELLTEPLLLSSLPLLNLSGMSTQSDSRVAERLKLESQFLHEFKDSNALEIFEEVFDKVESPPKPLPDIRDQGTFKRLFEERNKHLGLYYTKFIMKSFFELYEDIEYKLKGAVNAEGELILGDEWSLKVEDIENYIREIRNTYTRDFLKQRYVKLLY